MKITNSKTSIVKASAIAVLLGASVTLSGCVDYFANKRWSRAEQCVQDGRYAEEIRQDMCEAIYLPLAWWEARKVSKCVRKRGEDSVAMVQKCIRTYDYHKCQQSTTYIHTTAPSYK